jgi:formylglycine-generating enzyme required for sulfatase activity
MKALGLRLLLFTALCLASDSAAQGASDEHLKLSSPEHEWVLHHGKGWQRVSSFAEDPEVTDQREGDGGDCPAGMVEIRGRMKVDPTPDYLDAMQKTMCIRWLNEDFPERCAEYDSGRWNSFIAKIPDKTMAFCIDRFEYPNVLGQYPWVFVTFNEASDLCSDAGKRICSEDEWTFACEGDEALPYPTGYSRPSEACVIDRPWREYDEEAFADRTSRAALLELDRAWQGEASGSRPECRSPFGVYDMTGNVDEWTRSTARTGYQSILKGGYWAPVRDRCRASTRAHSENFALYQQGFRCCADARSP